MTTSETVESPSCRGQLDRLVGRRFVFGFLFPFLCPLMWMNRRRLLPYFIWSRVVGWHQLGRAVWKPSEFEPDYHWKFFGVPLREMPSQVNLGGIMHAVQVSDGLIVFSQRHGMFGHHSRICFERDSNGMLWYLKFSETWDRVPVTHVMRAFEYVREVYGGDFVVKRECV